jgi:hypothetical protein
MPDYEKLDNDIMDAIRSQQPNLLGLSELQSMAGTTGRSVQGVLRGRLKALRNKGWIVHKAKLGWSLTGPALHLLETSKPWTLG